MKGHSCGTQTFCSVSVILYDFTLSPPCCWFSPHPPGQRHHTLFQRHPAVPITPWTQTAVSPPSGLCSRAVWHIELHLLFTPGYLMSSRGLLSLLPCPLVFTLFPSQTSSYHSLLVFPASPNLFVLLPLSKPAPLAPPSLASPTHFINMLFIPTSRWLAKTLNDWQPAQRGHYLWGWWLVLCASQSGESSRAGQFGRVLSSTGNTQRKLCISTFLRHWWSLPAPHPLCGFTWDSPKQRPLKWEQEGLRKRADREHDSVSGFFLLCKTGRKEEWQ